MARLHRFLVMLVAGLAATGCMSMGAMQRADTLKPGQSQVLVETSIQGAVGEDLGDGDRIGWPYFSVLYRRGLSERTELSVGAAMLALQAALKLRLDDPLQEGLIISIAPGVGGSVFGEEGSRSGVFTATLPLLLGWRLGQRGQLVLSPRMQYLRTFPEQGSARAPINLFGVGTSLGVLIPLSRSLGVMPEVSVLAPFGVERFELYERLSPKISGGDGLLFQVGVGLLFGGLSDPEPELSGPDPEDPTEPDPEEEAR
jgi:hypothetical protein